MNSVVPAKGGAAKKAVESHIKKAIGPKITMTKVDSSVDKVGGAGATPKAAK